MKVGNTNWYWITREKDIQHATKKLNNGLFMSVLERKKNFILVIQHRAIIKDKSEYNLISKDIESACNEADDIARGEFTKLVEYYTNLINKLPDV